MDHERHLTLLMGNERIGTPETLSIIESYYKITYRYHLVVGVILVHGLSSLIRQEGPRMDSGHIDAVKCKKEKISVDVSSS